MTQRLILVTVLVLMVSPPAWCGTNVVVVLDDSGSMADRMRRQRRVRKMAAAQQALVSVLQDLPDDAQVGVLTLNRGSDGWVLPFGPLDKSQIEPAIRGVRASGRTPLGRFMKIGTDVLLQQREQAQFGTYRLLIVTDGEATDKRLVERYLPDILSRGLTVDVIGVDMESNHSLATQVHSYRRADDPESLRQAISEVFAESSSDANDAGESDFELLAGLPPEVASAALTALCDTDNRPIGTERTGALPGTRDHAGRTAALPGQDRGHPVNIDDSNDRGAHASGSSEAPKTILKLAFGFVCTTVLFMLVAIVCVVFLVRRFA